MGVNRRILLNSFMALIFCTFFTSCVLVNKDISSNPDYAFMIGKKYKTKQDLLIYKYSDQWRNKNLGKIGSSGLPDSNEMKAKLPFKYYGKKIMAKLPPNSVIVITRVKYEGTFQMAFPYYYAKILESNNSQFLNYELCLGPSLIIGKNDAPFDPEYFEEIK